MSEGKEAWVDEVLTGLDSWEEVRPNAPFIGALETELLHRRKQGWVPKHVIWTAAASLLLLVTANAILLSGSPTPTVTSSVTESSLSQDYNLIPVDLQTAYYE